MKLRGYFRSTLLVFAGLTIFCITAFLVYYYGSNAETSVLRNPNEQGYCVTYFGQVFLITQAKCKKLISVGWFKDTPEGRWLFHQAYDFQGSTEPEEQDTTDYDKIGDTDEILPPKFECHAASGEITAISYKAQEKIILDFIENCENNGGEIVRVRR